MTKHTPSLLEDALTHENAGLESLLVGVYKSREYGSSEPNSYIIAFDWATDSQGRGYIVLDVWFHMKTYLVDGDVERDRRLVLTVHLYEDVEYTKDGNNEYDKEPFWRYLDTAIAGVNGLDPKNGVYWIKTWGLEARVGQYAPATEEGEMSAVETGPGE